MPLYRPDFFQEPVDPFPVFFRRQEKGVVVPAPELDEGLRLRRRLVERDPLAEGRDLVIGAVDDQHGAPDVADVVDRVVLETRQPPHGKEGVVVARDVDEARKGGIENECGGRFLPGEFCGDGAAKRLAVEQDLPGGDLPAFRQIAPGPRHIAVGPFFGGFPFAPAVAPVIVDERGEPHAVQNLDEGEIVGDVPAVAMAEENNPPVGLGGHIPGRKLHAVVSIEGDLLVGHAPVLRRGDDLPVGEIDEPRLQEEHQGENPRDGNGNGAKGGRDHNQNTEERKLGRAEARNTENKMVNNPVFYPLFLTS